MYFEYLCSFDCISFSNSHFVPALICLFIFSFEGVNCCCSVTQSCLTLCDPVDCSTPGFPVPHHLRELAQTHVHWVGNATQPPSPLSSFLLASIFYFKLHYLSGGSDGKESACNAGDLDLVPGLGRSSGKGNGYPLQYSCLKNSMDRGA